MILLYTPEKKYEGKMYKGFENGKDINWHRSFIIGLVQWDNFSCPNFPCIILNYFNLQIIYL